MKAMNDNKSKFEEFHQKNPLVYELVKLYTKQAIDAGHEHYGIQSIFERIRWHTGVETKGDSFKINNNHTSFYARMFMDDFPQHEGFFRTRRHPNTHRLTGVAA